MAASPGTNGDATRLLSWKSPCTPLLALETNCLDATPDEWSLALDSMKRSVPLSSRNAIVGSRWRGDRERGVT